MSNFRGSVAMPHLKTKQLQSAELAADVAEFLKRHGKIYHARPGETNDKHLRSLVAPVLQHRCAKCGETNSKNFYDGRKSECKKCGQERMQRQKQKKRG